MRFTILRPRDFVWAVTVGFTPFHPENRGLKNRTRANSKNKSPVILNRECRGHSESVALIAEETTKIRRSDDVTFPSRNPLAWYGENPRASEKWLLSDAG